MPGTLESSSAVAPSTRSRSTVLWWVMLVASAAIAIYAASYFFLPLNAHFALHPQLLLLHISGGIGALLAGPWQFSQRLRQRSLSLHRWLGRFYLIEVGLGSAAGFGLALFSSAGMATHLGFGILAILWFATGLKAYRLAVQRNIEEHRRWMIRNYALTLAAVSLRIWLPLFLILHWPFATAFITVSWLCWVPNLLIAEWILQRDRRASTILAA